MSTGGEPVFTFSLPGRRSPVAPCQLAIDPNVCLVIVSN